MAVLCLLTNTPWPWPTPAGAASARGGFPTRNEVEGGSRRSAQAQRGRLGCLLSRARDGVPQEGLVTLLCAERRKMLCSSGGRCGRERPAEEGAGRRWLPSRLQAGGSLPLSVWPWSSVCRVCCGMRRKAKTDVRFGTPRLIKAEEPAETSCESVDLRSCCLQSLFGECSSL
jgi:hypothetical protein